MNSYIFIPKYKKEKPKEKKDGVINIDINQRVLFYIKQIFDINTVELSKDIFYKKSFFSNIDFNGLSYPVAFTLYEVVKNTYLEIEVTGKSKAQAIKCLEYIHDKLLQSNIHNEYVMVVSYDSISEYYCNKIYPKLNELERKLRKLLFNIYVVNFGTEYYTATTSREMQSKIKSVIQAKGNAEKKEIQRIQNFFYSMELSDIKNLLFAERWTSVEEKAKIIFLKENEKLIELSEDELRNAFERFTPKSDWERFFRNKTSDINAQELLEAIRANRNDIAHCKLFYKDQYIISRNAIKTLNRAILTAIKLTNQNDFSEKNNEAIKNALQGISAKFLQFQRNITKIIAPLDGTLNNFSNAFKPLMQSIEKIKIDVKK